MAGQKLSWLVYHYCQGEGLARCLRLLNTQIRVEVLDQHCDQSRRTELLARLRTFDHVIAEPLIARQLEHQIEEHRLTVLPTLAFEGYHPDFFLLRHEDGHAFAGPTGSSQSMLAYCAFASGLPEAEAVALYRKDVYEACGYLDQWEMSREILLASFSKYGFDLRREFIAWSRRGPFMHSIIHPRIDCLRDVARQVLRRHGMRVLPTTFLPPDTLADREVLPVYPEIAARLGIAGDTLFKRGNDQRIVWLPKYVERSYLAFRNAGGAKPHRAYAASLERVWAAIGAFT